MKKLSFKDMIYVIAVIFVAICLVYLNVYFKSADSKKSADETEVVVGFHIKGEVKNSGYYELEYNSRIKDAITCAGGETEKADLDSVNLAQFIKDGEEIVIPSVKNNEEEKKADSGKVNINTADIYELCKVKGIGENLAKEIIAYRNKNGAFSKIEHLKRVDGIGSVVFEKMKDSIEV